MSKAKSRRGPYKIEPYKPGQVNQYSSRVTEPFAQAASQAMLYGVGLTQEDMGKAQVGIASMGWEGNTCNMHLNELAKEVKRGIGENDMVGLIFHTIGVSDGISMGTQGMHYSLQSRDIIANSIETVVAAQYYDAVVAVPGCDKNMPGSVIGMARLNRPAIMVYGGTIRPGEWGGEKLDIVSSFEAVGQHIAENITTDELNDVAKHSLSRPQALVEECIQPIQWPRPLKPWD